MPKLPEDPGDEPVNAGPAERAKWQKARERFLTEGMGKASPVPAKTLGATEQRLAQINRERVHFLELHSPMKAAIQMALIRDTVDVLADAKAMDEYIEGREADFPGARRPAITEMASRLVAEALKGDNAAVTQIADRIEGKPGLRQGDEDPEDPGRRRQSADITARVIKAMTETRIRKAQIVDVEATPVPPKDKP